MFHWQDAVNGSYESLGGAVQFLNCWRLWQDKVVRGVSVRSFAFFASWGIWNLYYYPHLGQWLSFCGGLLIVTTNVLWVVLAVLYSRKELV